MKLQLLRDPPTQNCTLGILSDGQESLQTLELPWISDPYCKGGHPERSCVPAGEYSLVLHDSTTHPKSFCLVNPALGVYHLPEDVPLGVVARTCCLIHVANETSQLLGCIGVGRKREFVGNQWMVLDSRDAYAAFQAAVPWKAGHSLTIEYSAGVIARTS